MSIERNFSCSIKEFKKDSIKAIKAFKDLHYAQFNIMSSFRSELVKWTIFAELDRDAIPEWIQRESEIREKATRKEIIEDLQYITIPMIRCVEVYTGCYTYGAEEPYNQIRRLPKDGKLITMMSGFKEFHPHILNALIEACTVLETLTLPRH